MVMNAPRAEDKVAVEIPNKKPLQADVDLGRGFRKNDPDSVTSEATQRIMLQRQEEGKRKPVFNFKVYSPQDAANRAAASLSGSAMPEDYSVPGTVDPAAYTPQDFDDDINSMFNNVYSPQIIKQLQDNFDAETYGRFYYKRVYDTVQENPNLKNYLKEYYPEKIQEISDATKEYGVTVGETFQGDPIKAGEGYFSPFNVSGLFTDEGTPFNNKVNDRIARYANIADTTYRSIYALGQEFVGISDFVNSFQERTLEFFNRWSYMVNATPQGMARFRNKVLKASDAATIGGDYGIPQYTDEEIEGMTWDKLNQDPFTVTVGEKVQDFIARSFPIDAPKNSLNYPLLKPAPEGQDPNQQLAGPGNYPIGQGPTAMIENYATAMMAVAGGRGVLEIGKAVGRRTGKFVDPKTGKYDERAHQIAINKQRDSAASFVGRFFAAQRQGGLDSSRNLQYTLATEQLLAGGAIAALHELGSLGVFEGNPQAQGILGVTVAVIMPLVMIATGKFAKNLLYDDVAPMAEHFFNGEYKTVADLLNSQSLNTVYGRRAVEEMGRSLSTMEQQLPQDYDALMLSFKNFNEELEVVTSGLIEGGVSKKEAGEITGLMRDAKANGWSLANFITAQQQSQGLTRITRSAFSMKAKGSLGKTVDELKEMATAQKMHQQAEKAIQQQGIILTQLTNKYTQLEEENKGAPAEMRTTVIKMRNAYAEKLGLEKENASKFIDALDSLYNIAGRYNAGNQDTAIADARRLFNSFAPEDQGYFSHLVNKRIANNNNYGGFGAKLEEFESVQALIDRDRSLVDQMYVPLRENGILNELNVLDVKKPNTGTMRKTQTSLMDSVFKTNKDISDNNYKKVFDDAGGKLPVVNMGQLSAMFKQRQEDQNFEYGADALRLAKAQLQTLSRLKKPLAKIGQIQDLADNTEINAESFFETLNELQDLSLKEAVAIRSSIGQKAYELSKRNTSESRKGAAVLMEVQEIVGLLINDAAPPDSVIGASLLEAQAYYRDNVAGLFYDPYIRQALNKNADMPIPFVHAFSRSTLRKIDEDGGQDTPMVPVDDLLERRQTHFDKIFPEDSDLRPQAVQEMRNIMLARIFGGVDPQKVTRVEFVDRLRTILANKEAHPLFKPKEEGGFLDFILGDKEKSFLTIIEMAPIVGKNEVMSGNPLATLEAEAKSTLGPDSVYNNMSLQGDKEAIGEMVGEVAKQTSERREIEQSPTLGIFSEVSQTQSELASIGEVLVNRILQHSGEKAAEIYKGMVSDVGRVMPESVDDFQHALNKVIFDELLRQTSRAELDIKSSNRELTDFSALDDAMRENKQLIATVVGDDSYGAMKSFIKMGTLADNTAKAVYGGDIRAMSESAALSRMWGVARGVVSLRYVGSEWLLRKFASNKNEALLQVMAVPGLAQHIMSGVENGNYRPFFRTTMSQNLIPQLAAIMSDGEVTSEDYQESLRALSSLYQSSKENNLDFVDNVVSLILATRNKDQLAELNEINDIITQFTDPTTESRSALQKQMDALQPRPEVPESIMGFMRGNPKEGRLAPFGRP